MTKELLIKFLNDQITEDDLSEVLHWVQDGSRTTHGVQWAFQFWLDYKADDTSPGEEKYTSLLDKIHHQINLKNQEHLVHTRLSVFKTWITRAAAILLVPVMGYLVYILSSGSPGISPHHAELTIDSLEIEAPVGSKALVHFSDGSEVYLNHGSKIKYPQKFIGKSREVYLEGEGYFKVSHDPSRPFIVKTREINVRATGTTFNVYAYPSEKSFETTLIEGKVSIERIVQNRIIPLGNIEPGQFVSYNTTNGQIFSTKGDITKFISWKDDILIFKRDSIARIAQRLSRWYNVEIEIVDKEVREYTYTYTATFIDENLYQILDLLKKSAPISYKMIPRKQTADGTFTKQKILILKRTD